MTNFDFLKTEKQFEAFADVAISAESLICVDAAACAINCRRAMEFAIKWMYSVDDALEKPYQDSLISLLNAEDFREIVGQDLWRRLDLIRRVGNAANHAIKKISYEQAELCLKNLHIFFDFISYCYSSNYVETKFDESLLKKNVSVDTNKQEQLELDLEKLIAENKSLRNELTAQRKHQQKHYKPKPLELSEYATRKIYIDTMLQDAGWREGIDWINEVELKGMPNKSELGYADYVLYDDAHRPLAVIEAKKTCVDVAVGRQQAKLYADLLEKQCGRRPIVFLTNGFDTRIIDNQYPERKVSGIYSKRDIEKLVNLQTSRESLDSIIIDSSIAGRYYQQAAIRAVCDSFNKKNRRKALLVMATGSGKTRTVIGLVKTLMDKGWIKNVLFLADRNALVTQAKRAFVNQFESLEVTNLCDGKGNYNARGIFSTYQTMMHCIDSVKDDEGMLYTCGHFDLIICDEAHRSIYNKYKELFNYFDAPLVGLTATPKDEIDKNTYEIFELENGVPTYGYELAQAVTDGFLVDYLSVETTLKFISEGIVYDELSTEDKEEYEKTFEDEEGNVPEKIESSALNTWIFNEDTIKQVLRTLMREGLKIEFGQKIGKTIIFAKNHEHAEKILEIFNKEYPTLNGYAQVVDNKIKFSQSLIDDFSDPNKLPQIAISVDMLDTGIDVPEILNLVFFKKVMSKAKFWQMIGRGTRLCPGLLDGEDKNKFYIFDFCGNFEFFRLNQGKATANQSALQSAIFNLKFQMAYKLQDINYQIDPLHAFRDDLVEDMVYDVERLNRDSFVVKQHLKYVDQYSNKASYDVLTYEDTLRVKEEVAPLIQPNDDDASAVRFDALLYGIELAYLMGEKHKRAIKDLHSKVNAIASVANIPEIQAKTDLIKQIQDTDYVENAEINDFEHIRIELRNLMKYITGRPISKYETNFTDDILSMEWKDAELVTDDLENYRLKAEHYIRQHQDNLAIYKLKSNLPLTETDIKSLESVLWNELGTKADYEKEFGEKPLGELVREIIGLDMNAAKEAFAEYLNDNSLNSRQIYFVNQIVEYIVQNGLMKNLGVLQESPFTDQGSVVELFEDQNVWNGIRKIIEQINRNAVA